MIPANITIQNVSACLGSTPPQAVEYMQKVVGYPGLIILFAVMNLIFIISGLTLSNNKKKFFMIWLLSFILSLIIFVILLAMPNTTQSIVSSISSFLN